MQYSLKLSYGHKCSAYILLKTNEPECIVVCCLYTQLYGVNRVYIKDMQQYSQLYLFLTTKILILIIYKLTIFDHTRTKV
jgi:hypothetical protein